MALQKVADAFIGGGNNPKADYFESNVQSTLNFNCNYTDLCDDADAIAISSMVKELETEIDEEHLLSSCMRQYYTNLTTAYRYSQYEKDGLDFSNLSELENSITAQMTTWFSSAGFSLLSGDASDLEKGAAIQSFAKYLYNKIHS